MMTTRRQSKYGRILLSRMGEYHDVYLKTDVLLLTDAFEHVLGTCV